MTPPNSTRSPVAIIGAGPVGLAAAAHLVQRGLPVIVFEAGADVADNLASYRQVRLFSPWRYNIDRAARDLLGAADWQPQGGRMGERGGAVASTVEAEEEAGVRRLQAGQDHGCTGAHAELESIRGPPDTCEGGREHRAPRERRRVLGDGGHARSLRARPCGASPRSPRLSC